MQRIFPQKASAWQILSNQQKFWHLLMPVPYMRNCEALFITDKHRLLWNRSLYRRERANPLLLRQHKVTNNTSERASDLSWARSCFSPASSKISCSIEGSGFEGRKCDCNPLKPSLLLDCTQRGISSDLCHLSWRERDISHTSPPNWCCYLSKWMRRSRPGPRAGTTWPCAALIHKTRRAAAAAAAYLWRKSAGERRAVWCFCVALPRILRIIFLGVLCKCASYTCVLNCWNHARVREKFLHVRPPRRWLKVISPSHRGAFSVCWRKRILAAADVIFEPARVLWRVGCDFLRSIKQGFKCWLQ